MSLPPPDPLDVPVNLERIAAITGLPARTLRHWCATKRLEDWQPGGPSGHRYVTARALEAFGLPPALVAAVAAVAALAEPGEPAPEAGE